MPVETYLSKKPKLLRTFDKSLSRIDRFLASRHGKELSAALISEARRAYEEIIPQIPFIGERSPFLVFLLPATTYLAVHRAMNRLGQSTEETGRLIYEMGKAEIQSIPRFVRQGIGLIWFQPWFLNRLKKRALASQERTYQADYVLSFVDGIGQKFDYGVDYLECAACKFLAIQEASVIAPYVCAVDKVASEMMGWGLTRHTTLADGGEKCDFRFTRGGPTRLNLPQPLSQPENDRL